MSKISQIKVEDILYELGGGLEVQELTEEFRPYNLQPGVYRYTGEEIQHKIGTSSTYSGYIEKGTYIIIFKPSPNAGGIRLYMLISPGTNYMWGFPYIRIYSTNATQYRTLDVLSGNFSWDRQCGGELINTTNLPSKVLTKDNSNVFNPTPNSYQPATTKYVDESIKSAISTALGGEY